MLRIGSALSTIPDSALAAREAAKRAVEGLEGLPADLALLFHSAHHLDDIGSAVGAVRVEIEPQNLLGCTTEAVIAEGQEIEEGPALAVWAAHLDGAPMETFTVAVENMPDGPAIVGFPLIGSEARAVILLADPHTFPAPELLARLNADYPSLPIAGGMAGGGPGRNALILGDAVRNSGAVGVVLGPPIEMSTIVSQGCKPIGESYVITAAEGNVVHELGGKPPLERLRAIAAKLPPEEQALVQRGPLVGLVVDENKPELGRADFLIRHVIEANLQTGAMALGEYVQVGQTMQFHLLNAAAADEELDALLRSHAAGRPAGALLFACNGRGSRLFGVPHHDAHALETRLGPVPSAGMFCAGEIGPVGGRNFLHAFTASIALFSESEE